MQQVRVRAERRELKAAFICPSTSLFTTFYVVCVGPSVCMCGARSWRICPSSSLCPRHQPHAAKQSFQVCAIGVPSGASAPPLPPPLFAPPSFWTLCVAAWLTRSPPQAPVLPDRRPPGDDREEPHHDSVQAGHTSVFVAAGSLRVLETCGVGVPVFAPDHARHRQWPALPLRHEGVDDC